MVGRNSAFGLLIGAVVGTFSLIPDHGLAQDPLATACSYLSSESPLDELTRCAEQGLAGAQFSLGFKYDGGDGIPEDKAEAVRWYRQAGEQGYPAAQFILGLMYANGDGVPEDDAEAVRWFRLVGEQGDAAPQFILGTIYANGDGVPKDNEAAMAWFKLAAKLGHSGAQRIMNISVPWWKPWKLYGWWRFW